MNKSELVASVASGADIDRRQAESVLNTFFETVRSEAKTGGSVAWPGFGKFSTTQRSARTGRNPQTGASVNIPASTAMKFTASSQLKEFLNTKAAKKKAAAKKATPAKKASTTTAKATGTKASSTKATARKAPAKKATKR